MSMDAFSFFTWTHTPHNVSTEALEGALGTYELLFSSLIFDS